MTINIKSKLINLALVGAVATTISGCGYWESTVDEANYESLSNERIKHMELYSGGKMIKNFDNIKIIYSNSDSYSLWFEDSQGNKHYWQGEAFMDF
ncbi:hypothetical protein HYT23_01395 [Candidatus Pacearchaeota archaeon]|nr:hypothetical protein [Candidatus Pacearchaeota archaeon]